MVRRAERRGHVDDRRRRLGGGQRRIQRCRCGHWSVHRHGGRREKLRCRCGQRSVHRHGGRREKLWSRRRQRGRGKRRCEQVDRGRRQWRLGQRGRHRVERSRGRRGRERIDRRRWRRQQGVHPERIEGRRHVVEHVARRRTGESAATRRPGTLALRRQHALGDRDLLFFGGEVGRGRVLAAAVAGPGARRELQAAVVAVAGVDGPVAAGLAACDLIPLTIGCCTCLSGKNEASASEHCAGEGDLGDVDSRRSGLAMPSTHKYVWSSLKRPRGQLSGSGWRGRPAGIVETKHGFTPRSRNRPQVPYVRWTVGSPASIQLFLVVPVDQRMELGAIGPTAGRSGLGSTA